jgi:hypothetical protein
MGGFLTHPGIDQTKWEALVEPHNYLPAWAAPLPNALYDAAPMHPCAMNSMMPDRVIYQTTQWAAMPVATWESNLAAVVKNIQMKWPSAKRIEIMLSTVGPGALPMYPTGVVPNGMGNMGCPGGNGEQSIQAAGFTALDAMPMMFPGTVFVDPGVGKHFQVLNCSDFTGGPQYSAMGTTDMAKMYGDYFAAN